MPSRSPSATPCAAGVVRSRRRPDDRDPARPCPRARQRPRRARRAGRRLPALGDQLRGAAGAARRRADPPGALGRGDRVSAQADRIPDPLLAPGEEELDQTLRPRRLAEFVGQEAVKEQLSIFLAAARARNEPCEHVLLAGPPGLGKTSLAGIIAAEMSSALRVVSGPAVDRKADMAAILTGL